MSERLYRLILGFSLLIFLFFKLDYLIYAYIGLLFFEGLTNWRVPILVSKAIHKAPPEDTTECFKVNFEAERALRIIVGTLLILTFIMFPEQTWFFPWFIGTMLALAGITNLCPLLMSLKMVGLK